MSHGAVPTPGPIVVVGFMAAGKTTVGALLAERLGWTFVDLDHLIHERTGRTPGQLIRERGEAAFRELEAAVTREMAGKDRLVIAPGGGWATRPELAHHLGSGMVRIWLRVSAEEAVRRAEAEDVDRPLLGPVEGRRDRVARMLRSRERWYRQAEMTVDVEDREPARVVEEILHRLAIDGEDDER